MYSIRAGHRIGDEGIQVISEALKFNTPLTVLDLNGDERIIKHNTLSFKIEHAGNEVNERTQKRLDTER